MYMPWNNIFWFYTLCHRVQKFNAADMFPSWDEIAEACEVEQLKCHDFIDTALPLWSKSDLCQNAIDISL